MQIQLINFNNDLEKIVQAKKAYDKLYFYLVRAKFALEELQFAKKYGMAELPQYLKLKAQFEKWFKTLKNVDGVHERICLILERFENETVSLIAEDNGSEPDAYAFVNTNDTQLEIHLCDAFWSIDEEEDKYDTCIGTLLHELTHLVCNVDDIAYDINECQNLDAEQCINNANNYEYYMEEFKN